MTDDDLVDALARNVVGKPASACDWRDLTRVRDAVDELLNGTVNAAQNPTVSASTSPPAHAMARQEPRKRRSVSGPTPVAAVTRPAPKPAGASLTQEAGGASAAPHHPNHTPPTAA